MKREDQYKTAFICTSGFYAFNCLPFGLSLAPAIFQKLMDNVFGSLKWKIMSVYLDDLPIWSDSFPQMLERLEIVFQKLREANLRLNPVKCRFCYENTRVLDFLPGRAGLQPDPEKN